MKDLNVILDPQKIKKKKGLIQEPATVSLLLPHSSISLLSLPPPLFFPSSCRPSCGFLPYAVPSLGKINSQCELCSSPTGTKQEFELFPISGIGEEKMPLGLILGIGRAFRRKRTSSLDILSSKRAPRGYYKGKNCKPTGFHTRKGGYVVVQEKLPNYIVPDLTDFKLKPYVSQCPRDVKTSEASALIK
ncbi:hypothetical protein AHAS_Ahas17G0293400 [Arachis hypogaea]